MNCQWAGVGRARSTRSIEFSRHFSNTVHRDNLDKCGLRFEQCMLKRTEEVKGMPDCAFKFRQQMYYQYNPRQWTKKFVSCLLSLVDEHGVTRDQNPLVTATCKPTINVMLVIFASNCELGVNHDFAKHLRGYRWSRLFWHTVMIRRNL